MAQHENCWRIEYTNPGESRWILSDLNDVLEQEVHGHPTRVSHTTFAQCALRLQASKRASFTGHRYRIVNDCTKREVIV